MFKITLVLGGIRSGKSVFAEKKALKFHSLPHYIATAIPFDDEMKERVAIHQKRREENFITIEEPLNLTIPLKKLKEATVLVDCLTINLSNRLLERDEKTPLQEMIQADDNYIDEILKICRENQIHLILVANEVGHSMVSMNSLGRKFQDLQGRWNRKFAEAAHEVWFITAGISQLLKKESVKPFKIGAPSFVLPSGYLENIVYLQDKVDDVQLLLFDISENDPLFSNDTLSTLNYLAMDDSLSYSVHMPLQPTICADPTKSLERATTIISKMTTLKNITGFTFHFDLPPNKIWEDLSKEEIITLENLYIKYFRELKERFPEIIITLENTVTPFSALVRVVEESQIYFCADLGHLQKSGYEIDEVLPHLEKVKIAHLHGFKLVDNKLKDHNEVIYHQEIFKILEKFQGVLTIENYHSNMLKNSLAVVNEYF